LLKTKDLDSKLEINCLSLTKNNKMGFCDGQQIGWLAGAVGISEESDLYVTDIDWNEHYAGVGANLELVVSFEATYDREEQDIVSLEVKEATYNAREY
jgi:hypothetical protein